MKRVLDRREAAWFQNGVGWEGIHVSNYCGSISESLLRNAFEILCINYPILRAKVVKSTEGLVYEVESDDSPHFTVITVANGEELEACLLATSPTDAVKNNIRVGDIVVPKLARLIFAPISKSSGYIVLAIQHALTSGGAGPAYMSELWRLYCDLTDNNEAAVVPSPGNLPASPTKLLDERWGLVNLPEVELNAPQQMDVPCERVVHTVSLDSEKAEKLVKRVRMVGLSVSAVLIGETLSAMQKCDPSKSGSKKVLCLVGMHNRISPPAKMTETTCFYGYFTEDIPITDPLGIAKDFKRKVRSAVGDHLVRYPFYNTAQPVTHNYVDLLWNGSYGGRTYRTPRGVELIDNFELHVRARERVGRYEGKWGRSAEGRPKVSAFLYTHNHVLKVMFDMPAEIAFGVKSLINEIESRIMSLVE